MKDYAPKTYLHRQRHQPLVNAALCIAVFLTVVWFSNLVVERLAK
jgi:hypothetical protein